jgi:cation diffusion facilitator CzcD-associated flavoprotein CzcO
MAIAITTGTGPDGTAAPESSGISVLIVGCGFGGIAAAIECYRKGHKVVVFEKNSEIGGLGKKNMEICRRTQVNMSNDTQAIL